ncbi:sensor domain-containing diguanylate cyclase [Desulfofalx alkaliphila]|uniref:sensor domain-containing diguanylate cyclase n=1 Tax=Desulfofalx alkaliphila TaxID=105483 RepID=UPI0004E1E4E1|nr:diguanylate cyclase [Desulfofalx alkaliphila]
MNYEQFANGIPIPVFMVGKNGDFLFVNNSMIEMYGYNLKEFTTGAVDLLFSNKGEAEKFYDLIKVSLKTGQSGQYFGQNQKKNGETVDVDISWSVVTLETQKYVVGCVLNADLQKGAQPDAQNRLRESLMEIEERKEIEEELRNIHIRLRKATARLQGLSSIDHVTGLYNRVYLLSLLDEETKRVVEIKGKISLILIAIDYYEQYVEKFGIAITDQLTQYVAQTIQENLSSRDLAGRYTDGSFMVVLPDRDLAAAENFVKEVQNSVQNIKSTTDNQSIHITVSAGLTGNNFRVNKLKPDFAQRWMLQLVQSALNKAQKSGRNEMVVELA